VRALGGAQAHVGEVILECLPPRQVMVVTAEKARSKASHGAHSEHENQCFPSHVRLALPSEASAESAKTAVERSRFHDLGQDFALSLVQRFVDLHKCGEPALTQSVEQLIMTFEHGLDRGPIQDFGANGVGYAAPGAAQLTPGLMEFLDQRVDRLAYDLFLTGRGVQSIEQIIQHMAPSAATKAMSSAASTVPTVFSVAA
jgi:hypothetical protein